MTKKGKLLRLLFIKIPLFLVLFSVLWVVALKWMPVRVTPLMLSRSIEYRKDDSFKTHKKWTRLEDISPEMVKAVIASEDNLFDTHKGFDWKEIRKAIDEYKIEWIWGKERIMEVYLNVAEMGPGIYGAQAAARELFGKQAAELTRRESCLIAACLPSPLTRNAAKPSAYVQKRASQISSLEGKLKFPDWI